MIGTLTAFQWLIYDSFKVYLGVSIQTVMMKIASLTIENSYQPLVGTKPINGFLMA